MSLFQWETFREQWWWLGLAKHEAKRGRRGAGALAPPSCQHFDMGTLPPCPCLLPFMVRQRWLLHRVSIQLYRQRSHVALSPPPSLQNKEADTRGGMKQGPVYWPILITISRTHPNSWHQARQALAIWLPPSRILAPCQGHKPVAWVLLITLLTTQESLPWTSDTEIKWLHLGDSKEEKVMLCMRNKVWE